MAITYNPSKSDFYDVTNEKTDHKTDYKTDYDTDPGRVTKRERYQHCWHNYWGNRVCDWRYRTVTDWDKIRRHEEMNTGNDQLNKDNDQLNKTNTAKNQAYQSVVNTSKVTSSGEYASRRDFTLEESAAYLRGAGASEDEIRESLEIINKVVQNLLKNKIKE